MKSKPTTTEATSPRLLDLPAAAVFLGATTHFVRQLVRTGKLPHVKLGKKWAIDPADLEAWIAANKRTEVGAKDGASLSSVG